MTCGGCRIQIQRLVLPNVAVERFDDFVLRDSADQLLDHLPPLEDEERGDTTNLITAGCLRIAIDVELTDFDLAGEVVGDLVDHGRHHATRAAPGGPEIDEDHVIGHFCEIDFGAIGGGESDFEGIADGRSAGLTELGGNLVEELGELGGLGVIFKVYASAFDEGGCFVFIV